MPNKPRYNITYYEDFEEYPNWIQSTIFDRKTCKTIRLKIPPNSYRKAVKYFQDMASAVRLSISNYAKYKNEPQSVQLLEEQLYFQRTARYLEQNDFYLNDLLTSAFWEG